MTSSVVSESCRITVISSTLRADLAVPAETTVADLLTTLIASLGRQSADEGAANGGWILQRAGEPPLDPSSTLTNAKVFDGAVLHLRTRRSQLPEVAFDDVLDAVASGVLTRTARWSVRATRVTTASFGSLALALALLTGLATGPSWIAPSLMLGIGALALLGTAVAMNKIYGSTGAAVTAASFAIAYGAAAGATALGSHERVWDFGAPQLLLAAASACFLAIVCVLALTVGTAGFIAVILAALITAIATGAATVTTLSAGAVAALVAVVALAVSPALPTLSFRISRLPLPAIPSNAADLKRMTGRIDPSRILQQAVLADRLLTGLVSGVAVSLAGAGAVLGFGSSVQLILGLVLAVICLLRARLFTGLAQRATLLGSAAVVLAATFAAKASDLHGIGRLAVLAIPVLVIALALFALAVNPERRGQSPTLGRAADIIEILLVLSVIPLAIGVLGVYGSIHELVSRHS